ncbi:hypothetical protein Gferi_14715 [Geosporobacter ferrireducens]|uniref:Uncharacterized protein n=1 Tax=Geosporobacter ferrireducens TaxID=1424294 RepID=A0A1D8GIJ3_9FIRM|nr:hypothetical protein Gferi_14715 [Geosporobacter ferrireducens]
MYEFHTSLFIEIKSFQILRKEVIKRLSLKLPCMRKKSATKNKYEVISVSKKHSDRTIDKNFFKEMNYELAGDIGAIDHEDMMHNKKLLTEKNPKSKNRSS